MVKKVSLMLLVILMAAGPVYGCVGARPWGMGGAFVAVADDASAVYWNPAGLMKLQAREVHFTGAVPEDNVRYPRFLAYVEPDSGLGAGGVSWIQALGNEVTQNWFVYSYAREVTPNLDIGINARYETHRTDFDRGRGYSFDFGAMYQLNPQMKFGLLIQDVIASSIRWDNASDQPISMNIRPGLSYQVNEQLLLALEMYNVEGLFDDGSMLRLGGEYNISDFSLRVGAEHRFPDDTLLTVGLGYVQEAWGIDYAFIKDSDVHQVGFSHRF